MSILHTLLSSSRFVRYNIAYKFERLLDFIFLAAPVIALAFLACALYALRAGWMGFALATLFATVISGVVAYGRYIAPWQLRVKRLEIGDWRFEIGDWNFANLESPISNLFTFNCHGAI